MESRKSVVEERKRAKEEAERIEKGEGRVMSEKQEEKGRGSVEKKAKVEETEDTKTVS